MLSLLHQLESIPSLVAPATPAMGTWSALLHDALLGLRHWLRPDAMSTLVYLFPSLQTLGRLVHIMKRIGGSTVLLPAPGNMRNMKSSVNK